MTSPAFRDLTGMTFGMLKVIERGPDRIEPSGRRKIRYWCKCSCPDKTIVLVRNDYLTTGAKLSCGCTKNEYVRKLFNLPERPKPPSKSEESPEKKKLKGVVNKELLTFHEKKERLRVLHYVRGVYDYMICTSTLICDEWYDLTISDNIVRQNRGFTNFYNWSVLNNTNQLKTMVRIDDTKPYSPENCCWIDSTQYNPIPVTIPNIVKTVRFNGTRTPVDQVANALGYMPDPFFALVKSNFYEPIEVTMKNNVPYIYGNRCNYKINAIYFEDENGTLIDQSNYKEPVKTGDTTKGIAALWLIDKDGLIIQQYPNSYK